MKIITSIIATTFVSCVFAYPSLAQSRAQEKGAKNTSNEYNMDNATNTSDANYMGLFFEYFIQDTLGYLTQEKSIDIQKLGLQDTLNTKAVKWQDVIKESLHLSDTIDVAILDLWYKNRKHFRQENDEFDVVLFSRVFTDKYMEEGSKIDIWTDKTLKEAKKNITYIQAKELPTSRSPR